MGERARAGEPAERAGALQVIAVAQQPLALGGGKGGGGTEMDGAEMADWNRRLRP